MIKSITILIGKHYSIVMTLTWFVSGLIAALLGGLLSEYVFLYCMLSVFSNIAAIFTAHHLACGIIETSEAFEYRKSKLIALLDKFVYAVNKTTKKIIPSQNEVLNVSLTDNMKIAPSSAQHGIRTIKLGIALTVLTITAALVNYFTTHYLIYSLATTIISLAGSYAVIEYSTSFYSIALMTGSFRHMNDHLLTACNLMQNNSTVAKPISETKDSLQSWSGVILLTVLSFIFHVAPYYSLVTAIPVLPELLRYGAIFASTTTSYSITNILRPPEDKPATLLYEATCLRIQCKEYNDALAASIIKKDETINDGNTIVKKLQDQISTLENRLSQKPTNAKHRIYIATTAIIALLLICAGSLLNLGSIGGVVIQLLTVSTVTVLSVLFNKPENIVQNINFQISSIKINLYHTLLIMNNNNIVPATTEKREEAQNSIDSLLQLSATSHRMHQNNNTTQRLKQNITNAKFIALLIGTVTLMGLASTLNTLIHPLLYCCLTYATNVFMQSILSSLLQNSIENEATLTDIQEIELLYQMQNADTITPKNQDHNSTQQKEPNKLLLPKLESIDAIISQPSITTY